MNKTATTLVILIVVALGIWLLMRDKPMDISDTGDQSQVTQQPVTTQPDTSANTAADASAGIIVDSGITTGTGSSGTTGNASGTMTPKTVSFTVDASNFKFAPSTMTVNKGDTVKITLKDGQGSHNLEVAGFGVKTKLLNTGGTDTIQFIADKAGTFEYYCTVGNHRAMGMKGTLTVK